jgi:hypothetical protein
MSRQGRSGAGSAPRRAMLAWAPIAIAAAGLMPGAAQAQSTEIRTLEVTPEKGTAPLGVILTGPPAFVSQAHDFIFTHGACAVAQGRGRQVFTIDWGDDPAKTSAWPKSENPECKLTHDYTAPGTYKIRVGFFLPGSGDTPEAEWLGEATITVAAP